MSKGASAGSIRCLTLNLWGENGPFARRLELVVEGLRELQPDVVALQEVRDVPGKVPNQAEQIGARAGYTHVFAPSVEWGGGTEGLAILARDEIGAHEVVQLPHGTAQEQRTLLSARVDMGAGALWVHTTHLNYRLHHGKEREDQVLAAEAAVAAHAGDLPSVMMGDFNATPEADEIRWLRGLTTLAGRRVFYQDAWATAHGAAPGITWAKENGFTAPLHWLQRDRRIDYIFVTPVKRDGCGVITTCDIVLDRPDPPGVFPSDHFGLMADVQIIPGPIG